MQNALKLYDTTIGKKAVMALSGLVLVGFSIGHMAGNLQVFGATPAEGANRFNEYACMLHSTPALLWGTRLMLLAAFGAHIVSAFMLWKKNTAAAKAGGRYKFSKPMASSFASRTMYWTGPIFLFYILFHLIHLTLGGYLFGGTEGEPGHILGIEGYVWSDMNRYNNLVLGFEHLWVVAIYAMGVIAIGIHIYHGFASLFQSLGLSHPKYNQLRSDLSVAASAALTCGFLMIPIAVQIGVHFPNASIGLHPTDASYVAPVCEALAH